MVQLNSLCHVVEDLRPSPIRAIAEEAQKMAAQGIDVCNLTIGRPDFDTPSHIKEEAKLALDRGFVHYTSTAGELSCREAICRSLYEDEKVACSPDEVIVTMGGGEAGYVVFRALFNPGDELLVPDPMYVYYDGWARLCGAKCVAVPTFFEKDFTVNGETFGEYLTPRTKAILLTSPHNPTGQVYDRKSLASIAELCLRHNLYVIFDNIYGKLLYDGAEFVNIASFPGMKERTVIVSSYSKTYAMDGWRIGYVAAPSWMMGPITRMHQHVVSCANTFVQKALEKALTSSQECVEEMRREFDRRRRLVMSSLDGMNLSYPTPRGAFYVFPKISEFGMPSLEFSRLLLREARLATVPGSAFGACGEGYIRIAYTIAGEKIAAGLSRMRDAVEKLRNG